MSDMQNIQASIAILKEVKDLISPSNPWIPVMAAVLGALAGGLAPIFVKLLEVCVDRRAAKRAVAHQIYAEVSAILEIVRQRGYLEDLESKKSVMTVNSASNFYQVKISEVVDPLYRANLERLPLLDPGLQTKIVMFYRFLNALVEDIKPGGTFNTSGATLKGIDQFLAIANQAVAIGEEIKSQIAKQFNIHE